MATDISKEINQLKNAVYGEEVRGAFISCMEKIHEENESYDNIKAQVAQSAENVEKQVGTIDAKIEEVQTSLDNLADAISNGKKQQTAIEQSVEKGKTQQTNLEETIKNAKTQQSAIIEELEENSNTQVNNFNTHVAGKTQESEQTIADARQQAVQTVAKQGELSVQTVKNETAEYIKEQKNTAKEEIDSRANEIIEEMKKAKISYKVIKKIQISADAKIACTAITINTTDLSFTQLEETKQLTATVTPYNTTDVISWRSSNVEVATVTAGLVKAVGYGTAEITVTCGTQTASCKINVKKAEVEVISDKIVIPDSHNTGIESNVVLQEVTPAALSGVTRLQMTQQIADNYCDANAVISNYHFNGIYVDFNKSITQTVTFRNCKFTGDGNIAYAVAVSAYGTDKGIIFENCEFSHYKSAVLSGTWKATFDKCYVHDMMQDAFKINRSDIYLKNSYIRSLGIDATSHADGVQIENNTAEVTVHIYNCRFDQPHTSSNTENAAIFAKCKDANIILDVQKCCATGGNYTIYALNSETAKVSGKVECVVGCNSRYGIANIADGVEQNVVSADSLLVSTAQNGKLYVTNYTNKEKILKIVTDIEEKTVTIPKSATYSENHAQEFSMYPFDVLVEFSAGAKWVKCYENNKLIRTQLIGG